jgi:hypothetical protein
MVGRVALWVALAVLTVFFFAMAARAGRDVLDDQQLPRRDKQNEYAMCALWVVLGAAAGLFLFLDAFFFNPTPPSMNRVPTK